jgi:hypothetical protein
MIRRAEHDLQTMLGMIEKGSEDERRALGFIDQYRQSCLRVLTSKAENTDKVEALGQLREDLLHQICAMFDPLHLKDTNPEIDLGQQGNG